MADAAVEIAGDRKPAPMIQDLGDAFGDDRFKITEAYDKQDPKWVHSWMKVQDADAGTLSRLSAEIVKSEGREIRHGGDLLIRRPRKLHVNELTRSEQRSLRSAKKIAGEKNADYLVQKASPRRPVREKQDEEEDAT